MSIIATREVKEVTVTATRNEKIVKIQPILIKRSNIIDGGNANS